MTHWSRYLESLCKTYAQWWEVYTITDVVGRKREEAELSPLLFDFGLMVQTVEREEKIERLTVLEGLHKYASEHVLLVGRPGSGKSTALVRLVLEEAEKNLTPQPPSLQGKGEQESSLIIEKERGEHFSPLLVGEGQGERSTKVQGNQPKIPVLVELRYYRTSILDLIQDFLQRHDPNLTVEAETLKTWLREGQLLLLVDGLNELPSEEARRELQKFRQDYQQTTPMIFTTRDLGVGGDLDIAKKLEMQPLNEAQMQQFVRAYLPEQGEQMLRQLGSRLREFGQTPLLLWMLCSLFKVRGKVPPNLGLVFRQFAQSYYDKLKQDVPVSDESRRWCQLMLQHLAWRMTQGREATELQVAISRQEAEEILTAYLRNEGFAQPRNCAMEWLADLLKHHLLQLGTNNQIEFRHQLIQEHCTAESLLKVLPSLSNDELKRKYLNYLKWTEPLALMLELVEDEAQAVRVVKLALEVDWWLGARLAGAVKPEWQEQTVSLVAGLDVTLLVKIQLLGFTKSDKAIFLLIKVLEHKDHDVRGRVVATLGGMDSKAAISALIKVLEDQRFQTPYVRGRAAHSLSIIGSELAIPPLIKALQDESPDVRDRAANALRSIGSELAIPPLIKFLKDQSPNVRKRAAFILGGIGSELAIPALIRALEDTEYDIRKMAVDALGEIGGSQVINSLIKTLKDKDCHIRSRSAYHLGKIGRSQAIPALKKALEDTEYDVRKMTADALNKIGNLEAIDSLTQALKYENYDFRKNSTRVQLKSKIGSASAIQHYRKFYNPTLLLRPLSLMHILHLSDLHFGTPDQANLWSNQLAADLYNDLSIPHLDALILSGDIANYSTPAEYDAAKQFLDNLRQDFPLNPEQIILVPGNHDLNWNLAKKAYKLIDRDDYDEELKDGHYIEESASVIRIRDEAEYKQRFAHFSQFYETIKQNPYPRDYDQQFTLDHLPEQNLLILGLNSAWQLDHYYKSRASINTNALSNALTQIRRNPDYRNSLKIAVWHHPLDSAYSDRITDQGFLEQLAVNGFRFFLHGHIHKAETSLFRYDMSSNGRKLDRICAGTFGAPVREWVPGYPLQYNLLKLADNQLTVITRRREELNGAWKPDARWLQGAGQEPLSYYAITL